MYTLWITNNEQITNMGNTYSICIENDNITLYDGMICMSNKTEARRIATRILYEKTGKKRFGEVIENYGEGLR